MAGLHINSLLLEHEEYVGRVRPGVNLLLNPKVEQALILKERSPESKLIGRVTIAPGDGVVHSWFLSSGTVDGAKAAGKRAAEYCMAQGVPQCDAWTINNEPPVESLEHIRLLAEFDSEFARAMQKAGKRACIGTFSRGTPQIPQEDGGAALSTYAPALRVAHETGAWLVFHAYGKYPLLHDADFLALRWQRRILPWYRAQGVPIPRYVITEAGVDLGTGIDAQNNDGWRNTPYKDDIASYGRDLLALMREYAKDSSCLGATIFCAGHAGWESFVVDGPLLGHLAALPWPSFGTATPIPAPPTPIPPAPVPQPPTPAPPKEDVVNLPSWVKVEKAQGAPGTEVWRLAKAVYLPPEGEGEPNSQGRHHIDIMEPHDPTKRVVVLNKQTGEITQLPLEKPQGEPAQNVPMWGEPNSYTVYMAGAPSDVVSGLAMKGNRHVVFQLWFQLVKVPETAPTPQPEVPVPIPTPRKPIHEWSPSPNFTPANAHKDTIVWHHTAGAWKASLDWLRNPTSGVSSDYLITKAGKIYQLVADTNIAWHAGYSLMPDGREDVNRFSYGVELENAGDGRDPYPPAQIDAAVALARYLVAKNNIRRGNQVTHELIRRLWKERYPNRLDDLGRPISYKTDPRGLDMQKFLDRIYAPVVPTPPLVKYDKVVWSLEQAARNLQAEGLQAEHDYIVKTVLPPLIKLRDGG